MKNEKKCLACDILSQQPQSRLCRHCEESGYTEELALRFRRRIRAREARKRQSLGTPLKNVFNRPYGDRGRRRRALKEAKARAAAEGGLGLDPHGLPS